MPRKPASQKFRIRLLQDGVTIGEALKVEGLEQIALKDGLPFDAALYVKPQSQREPPWVPYLESGTEGPIDDLTNISTGAILFVTAKERIFAITFGYGHTLLRPGSYESGFGLKVVLNSVDPSLLQSVDAQTIDDTTVHTRVQVSQLSSFDSFGVDITTDLLRALTGIPRKKTFARRVTGSDALAISRADEFIRLGDMCSEILQTYQSDEYLKAGFSWIDHLEEVKNTDVNLVGTLNNALLKAIQEGNTETMHLAPPEVIDWNVIDDFHYSHEKPPVSRDDLRIGDLLESFEGQGAIDIDFLKTRTVRVNYATAEASFDKWRLYNCIVFETESNEYRYVLTDGKWYQVSKTFVDEVRDYVSDIEISALTLPDPIREREEDYMDLSELRALAPPRP